MNTKKTIFLLTAFFHFTFVFSQTPIGGVFTVNTTLTIANSPYQVTNNILVAQGVTVTVDPGVVISFNNGLVWQVEGEFRAIGTTALPITFTGSPGGWAGFRIMDTSNDYDTITGNGTILSHCIIENEGQFLIYTIYNSYSVHIENSSPQISDCVIRNFYTGVDLKYSSARLLRNKIFNGQYFPLQIFNYGFQNYTPFVYQNEIYNCNGGSNAAITLWGGALFRSNCVHDISDAVVLRIASNYTSVDSNTFMNCPNAVIGFFGGFDTTVRITNNTFSGNRINLVLSACIRNAVIRGNNFMNFTGYHVYCDDYYFPFSNYDCNAISGSYLTDLHNNYWGGLNNSQMMAAMWDYNDDFMVGVIVGYSPWASTPFALPTLQGCDLTTSLTSYSIRQNISVFPNPFSQNTTIRFSEEIEHGTILIKEILGKTTREIPIKNSSELIIEKNNLLPGIYFLFLDSEKGNSTAKIIIE